jgi:plastocyanin
MRGAERFPVVVVLALALSCTQDPVDEAEANVVGVTIDEGDFSPRQITVKVGQTVRWTWAGGNHNVVSGTQCKPDDAFRSGAAQAGGSFDKRFEKAGSFAYYCEVHCPNAGTPGATAQVDVQP